MSGSSSNGMSSPSTRVGGAPGGAVTATPGSYMYTSSSGLLRGTTGGEKVALARAVPPPTLPKYTSSGSFRLASLDRLAHRQRLFDQGCNGSVPTQNGTAEGGGGGVAAGRPWRRPPDNAGPANPSPPPDGASGVAAAAVMTHTRGEETQTCPKPARAPLRRRTIDSGGGGGPAGRMLISLRDTNMKIRLIHF
ncbi:Uncharacterized protein GBIM_17275 [Gryllus bimaculatus]|nr:Uncharacterized protein GBIM_17275 [Gryllus bimaculatus]